MNLSIHILLILAIVFIVAAAFLYHTPETPEYVALAVVAVGILFLIAWAVLLVIGYAKNR